MVLMLMAVRLWSARPLARTAQGVMTFTPLPSDHATRTRQLGRALLRSEAPALQVPQAPIELHAALPAEQRQLRQRVRP